MMILVLKVNSIGITSGASVPDILVKEVMDYLKKLYPTSILKTLTTVQESIQFGIIRFERYINIIYQFFKNEAFIK